MRVAEKLDWKGLMFYNKKCPYKISMATIILITL
jgi:hypothetical protein